MSTYAGSSRPPAASTRSSVDRPTPGADRGDLLVLDHDVDPRAVRQGCVDDRQPCHAAIRPSIDHNGAVSLYRDEGVVLRTQKLGEADRIITLLTRSHGRVRAVGKGVRRTRQQVRGPAGAVHPRRPADLRGPLAGRRAAGRDAGVLRRPDRRRLRPLHLRHRDARDGRAAHRGGAGAGHPAVPAAGRRPADAGRGGARPRPGAGRLPAALAGRGGLRRVLRRLRASAPGRGRTRSSTSRPAARSAAPAARPARSRRPAAPSTCSPPCSPATG